MFDLEINSLEDLYKRIKPALYSKVAELKRNSCSYIQEVDIWNYLSNKKWKTSYYLDLRGMVDDILYLNSADIKNYVLETLGQQERKIIKNEEGTLL